MALPPGYREFIEDIKSRIRSAQIRAAVSVNHELVRLYWGIGRDILARQSKEGWGAGVIDRLAQDLRREFPDMKGFSPRNLLYMKQFAEIYRESSISQQAVAKLPWGHNVLLVDKLDSNEQRLWYAQMALRNGWSRNILIVSHNRT